ncbi:MAG: SDR family NAD(P)-dependent oxidoreductase [Candidatus Saccharimonadaceae bacterium]
MFNPFSLEGKVILVTGASSGIGRATAIECSKMGAKLVITARNDGRLKDTLSLLEGEGHQYIVADLSKKEEIDNLVMKMPIVNGVVNNAGFIIVKLLPFIKSEDLSEMLKLNLEAPILLTNEIVKKKKMTKNSSFVFVSSIGRYQVSLGNSMYSTTKGGLSSFMKNAALDLAGKKIRCNAVLPGMVETPLIIGKENTEEQLEIERRSYPLMRFGHPAEIAYAIIFLLSDASAWMTGTEIVIDGGRSLK